MRSQILQLQQMLTGNVLYHQLWEIFRLRHDLDLDPIAMLGKLISHGQKGRNLLGHAPVILGLITYRSQRA
jgi:hypothetical protein